MVKERSEKREVVKIQDGTSEEIEQQVVREVPLSIFVNGEELVTLLTLGDANRELAVGFLLSEGILKNREALLSLQVDDSSGKAEVRISGDLEPVEILRGRKTVTSGGGKGVTFHHPTGQMEETIISSDIVVPASRILALMDELNRRSDLYRETGGVHNSALSDGEKIILFRCDIGRHNGVDKIHGAAFFGGIALEDKLLLNSGRISSEMVVKAVRMGVPILISRSAPTSLALDLSARAGLTLVGYVRGNSMVVYTGRERIEY